MDEDEEVNMTLEEATREINRLLARIKKSEDFITRAEKFYREKNENWHSSIGARIEIFLERKREQVETEKDLVHKIGLNVALGRYPRTLDELEGDILWRQEQ
jgi:hypothetical protein